MAARPTLTAVLAIFAAGVLHLTPAFAGQSITLRQDPADENGQITLGDLFDGAGDQAQVVVTTGKPGLGMVLDAGRVQMFAHAHGLDWDNPNGIRRLIVKAGVSHPAHTGGSSNSGGDSVVVTGPATHAIQILAYARDIAAGEVIRSDDVEWSRTAMPLPGAPRDAEAVVGMAARRPLHQGTAVAQHDVTQPQVIKRDDVIALIYSQDGVTLTLQAKALENAVAGQSFNVLNPESKKVIQAVAAGPGQAVVGPQADQMKSNSRLDPSQLASLH